MKFISVRDLRNTPSEVWSALDEGDDLVLTSNGRPRAIVVRVGDDDLASTMDALRLARAQMALTRIRTVAREAGQDRLSDEEIEAEIRATRSERHSA